MGELLWRLDRRTGHVQSNVLVRIDGC